MTVLLRVPDMRWDRHSHLSALLARTAPRHVPRKGVKPDETVGVQVEKM